MIALDIQPYCNNCPYFEARTEHECLEYTSIEFGRQTHEHKYVITCQNKEQCEEIVKHLKQLGI